MQMEICRHFVPRRGIQEKCNLSIDKVDNHCYNIKTLSGRKEADTMAKQMQAMTMCEGMCSVFHASAVECE